MLMSISFSTHAKVYRSSSCSPLRVHYASNIAYQRFLYAHNIPKWSEVYEDNVFYKHQLGAIMYGMI